jgi:heat shock protein HslJ
MSDLQLLGLVVAVYLLTAVWSSRLEPRMDRRRHVHTRIGAGTLAALFLALAIVACGGSAGGTPSPVPVQGRIFTSTGVTVGGARLDLVPGTEILLIFETDGTMSALAGCNSMGGTYRIDGGVLHFEPGSMTAMGCDPPRHAQDDWLARILASRPTIAFTGDELTLTAGDTVIHLADWRAEPDRPLVGPLWTATTILRGETASSLPAGVVATIQLAADGTVTLRYGCNEGGGKVTVEGDVLVFTGLGATDKACPGAAGQVEAAMQAVLGAGRVTYTIEGAQLTLDAGANGLIFVGR